MRVAILLAAGRSTRFRHGNKLLARHRGRALIDHALAAARVAPIGRVVVVVGHDRWRIAARARGPRTSIVFASGYQTGLAASLRAGLNALRPREREIFVFLGDIPSIDRHLPARLARAMGPGFAAVRPRGPTGPGHPVLLRRPDRATIERFARR